MKEYYLVTRLCISKFDAIEDAVYSLRMSTEPDGLVADSDQIVYSVKSSRPSMRSYGLSKRFVYSIECRNSEILSRINTKALGA